MFFPPKIEDADDVERTYEAADLRRLLASCPSVDALLDLIVETPVPAGWAVSPDHRSRWQGFVTAAREIKERRTEGCEA